MCLSTAYKTSEPDSIIMEYVSKIEVEGNLITLTDVIGDTKTVEGTIKMVDLTGGVVKINCLEMDRQHLPCFFGRLCAIDYHIIKSGGINKWQK